MYRKTVSLLLVLMICFIIPMVSFAENELDIKAKSAILMDFHTKEIIYQEKPYEPLAPASISKIMTLLLGMEALTTGKIGLDDKVRVSSHAAGMGGSQLWLEEGETQTVEDLFKSIVIRSANDASVALAEHVAGDEEVFVKMMNEKAKALGMKNTNFTNASGLPDENNYVSSYDVALMSVELLKYKEVHKWLTTYMDEVLVGKKKDKVQSLVNTNRLIKEYEGATGIKTGSTQEAGYCLAASAKRGNLQLIAVVMGSDSSRIRFDESMRLLDYGFANYDSITIGREGDVLGRVPINKGVILEIEAALEEDSFILLPKGGERNISKEIILPEYMESPIKKGQEIGVLIINIDGKEIDSIRLISNRDVERAGFGLMLKKVLGSYIQ